MEAESIALIQSMELEQSKLKLQEAHAQLRRNEQELKVRSEAEKTALMRYTELEQSNLKLQEAYNHLRRNEQELKVRSEAEKTALMRSIEVEQSNLQEAQEQIRRNEQEFNFRLESEKNMLTHSMELRFEAHVRNHTAEIRQTLKISDVSHAIASNYAHTRLIYQLDFKSKRVMIYSHYSEHDEVESYNFLALECIEHYFDYIIILTNCPNKWILHNPDYNKYHLLAYNMKSDFRNYGLFLMQTAKTIMHAAQLCFMNDSFVVVDVNAFGCSIKRLFENETGSHDFVGLTSSHECGYHVQSYFMCFNASVVPTIISYFETHGLPVNHHAAISQYELGITAHLTKLGFSSFAIVSNNDMRFPRNTTCFKWAAVLQEVGIIKRQHFFKKYPSRTGMTDVDIAQAAEKYLYNKHFMHFLKYHNININM